MFMTLSDGRRLPDRPANPPRGAVPPAGEPILRAENLRLRYASGVWKSWTSRSGSQPGQIVGVFGPNGAGKTTSVRAVSGFLKTEGARVIKGRITLFGHDVTNAEPHRQARLGVSFVPERNKVFPSLSVAENLAALGRLPRGRRRAELSDFVFASSRCWLIVGASSLAGSAAASGRCWLWAGPSSVIRSF